MKYSIYLDENEIETFFSDETEALKKYEEYKEEYSKENIYDKLTLFAFRTVKENDL